MFSTDSAREMHHWYTGQAWALLLTLGNSFIQERSHRRKYDWGVYHEVKTPGRLWHLKSVDFDLRSRAPYNSFAISVTQRPQIVLPQTTYASYWNAHARRQVLSNWVFYTKTQKYGEHIQGMYISKRQFYRASLFTCLTGTARFRMKCHILFLLFFNLLLFITLTLNKQIRPFNSAFSNDGTLSSFSP